jgi:hypothetical protein
MLVKNVTAHAGPIGVVVALSEHRGKENASRLVWTGAHVGAERPRRFVDVLGNWLSPGLVAVVSATLLAISLGLYAVVLVRAHPPLDEFGHVLAGDLAAHVTAGALILHGDSRNLYDLQHQRAAEQALIGGANPDFLDVFVAPPPAAFLYVPLAAIPYRTAILAWTVLSVVLIVVNLRLLWPILPNLHRYGFGRLSLTVFSTWPVLELLGGGQDAAVSTFLLTVGLYLLLGRRDLLAGALLGLGAIKPQLFFLIPVFFLVRRNWRAMAGWSGVTSVLAVGSALLLGKDGVQQYIDLVTSDLYRSTLVEGPGWQMQSLINPAWWSMLPASLTIVAALIVLLGGGVLYFVIVRGSSGLAKAGENVALSYALLILITALVSAHFMLYDCVILVIPALILLNHDPKSAGVRLLLAATYALTWSAPSRYLIFGHDRFPLSLLGMPWTIVPLCGLAVITWRMISSRRDTRQCA